MGPKARRWLFRFLAMVCVPALLLSGIELLLRAYHLGYPTSFFLVTPRGSQRILIENAKFGWRFFPRTVSRIPHPIAFPADKPQGTRRIFVLGESAALGDPDPAFGFSRIVRALLEARHSGQSWEVINVAMTAINSHAILPIARECAEHSGDLWVLYMGNNEVMGPFGAGTIFGAQAPRRTTVCFSLALQKTRIGQLCKTAVERLRPATGPSNWGGLEMFLQQQIPADDPRLARVYGSFAANLEAILNTAERHGIRVVLSTVASNLKDCAPFASQLPSTLPAAQYHDWTRLNQMAVQLARAGKTKDALERFEQTSQIYPDHAQLQFQLAQCYTRLGQLEKARPHFRRARDLDELRFRADSRLNEIIRAAAAQHMHGDVRLVDAAAMFDEQSRDGVAGADWFFDHVHFNFDGNYLLAKRIASEIESLLPPGPTNSTEAWPDREWCARRLAFTPWNQYQELNEVRSRSQRPPFTLQWNHSESDRRLQTQINELRFALAPAALEQWAGIYQTALARAPDDWELLNKLGALQQELGNVNRAAAAWRRVIDLVPQFATGYYQLGKLLNRGADRADAERYLRSTIRLVPNFPEAHHSLGIVLAHQNKFDEACREFASAIAAKPDYAEAEFNWGLTLAAQRNFAAAVNHFERALQIDSRYAAAHFQLARTLARQNSVSNAVSHYLAAFRLSPQNAQTHFQLGTAATRNTNYAEALARFKTAVQLQPNFAEAHYQLGLELLRQNQTAQAIQQFRETLRLNPAHPQAKELLERTQSK